MMSDRILVMFEADDREYADLVFAAFKDTGFEVHGGTIPCEKPEGSGAWQETSREYFDSFRAIFFVWTDHSVSSKSLKAIARLATELGKYTAISTDVGLIAPVGPTSRLIALDHRFFERRVVPKDFSNALVSLISRVPSKDDGGQAQRIYVYSASAEREKDRLATADAREKLQDNATPLIIQTISLLDQIREFREAVRAKNDLETDHRARLYNIADQIESHARRLLEIAPQDGILIEEDNASEAAEWLSSFQITLKIIASEYIYPDNVAKAVLPTSIILTCGTIGGIIGGGIGFGAGAYLGQLFVAKASPEKLAERISRELDSRDP